MAEPKPGHTPTSPGLAHRTLQCPGALVCVVGALVRFLTWKKFRNSMSESVPRGEDASRTVADESRRGRLPAWRDVRHAIAAGHRRDDVYAVESRPGGVVRYILKYEKQRVVEDAPPVKPPTEVKENARKRKSRKRKDAFHQHKREEAAMAIGLLPQAAIGGSQHSTEHDDELGSAGAGTSSGKREAALAGADKTPTKADEVVVDEAVRSSGRKKAVGALIFSNADGRRTLA